jgi:predicted MFS family arabinose efflux permease
LTTETTRPDEDVPADRAAASPSAAAPSDSAGGASVLRDGDFRRLFIAASLSKTGVSVSLVALPLAAILALHASPGAVGLLGSLSTAPYLLIGLPAGAWVDRLRRRRVMISADLLRAALFGTVPLAWWAGALTLWQLYAVAFIGGVATVFFDVSAQTHLPDLVGRERLVGANTALASADSISQIAGRGAAGFLVQALTAPVAIVANAVGYLGSGVWLLLIRKPESAPVPLPRKNLAQDVGEGLKHVFGHPLLRPLILEATVANFSYYLVITMLPVMLVQELRLPEWSLGVFLAVASFGILVGSQAARPLARRLGAARALSVASAVTGPWALLVPFIAQGARLWIAIAAFGLVTCNTGVSNVIMVSFRQRITPDPLLGRMNATFRFLLFGAVSLGSAAAGLLGQYAGARAALWAGAIGYSAKWLFLYCSPLRGMRALPSAEPARPA